MSDRKHGFVLKILCGFWLLCTLSNTNIKQYKNKNINKKKEESKKNKYENKHNIMGFAMETHGAIGDNAKQILQKISAKISFNKNKAYSMVMHQLRTRITARLMKANAKMVLTSLSI